MKYAFIAFLLPLLCATAQAETAAPVTLTFEQAEAMLLARNREIQAAQRMVEGLRADGISAAQRPNPTLSLGVTSINLDHRNSGRYWDKPLDNVIRLDQTIEGGDKRNLRIKAAESAIHAGQEDARAIVRQQRLALASSYYGLLQAQEKDDIYRQSAELYAKSIRASELRLKAGDISSTELSRLQVEAYRAENDARQAQAELEKSRQALAYLIGAERKDASISASGTWPETESTAYPDIEALLAQRPDILAAMARVEAANARRAQARALLKRDISVGVQYEHYPPDASNTVGVGVSFPLFANYQFQGEIQRAESDYGAALESLEQVRAQAVTEIRSTRSDLEAAADRIRRYRSDLLAKAGKSAAAAEFAYSRGAISLLDLLDARRTLKAVQLEAVSASYDYARALAAWAIFTNKP